MNRPWKDRIWFYKPDLSMSYWSWKWDLRPFWFGDDEYHWKTIVLGTRWTGRVVIALRPFRDVECDSWCWELKDYPGWPIDFYTWKWGELNED